MDAARGLDATLILASRSRRSSGGAAASSSDAIALGLFCIAGVTRYSEWPAAFVTDVREKDATTPQLPWRA